eukprot:TRINITY_DN5266_c0_g1_i1.p1 TRINITY_DN5266_c0_g1~~TRINITY_DN5266_c0_g1_i1.p1  ORF type:complete len:571 (+),score=40.59 TRINITY_DN5266_c0_g1_i1:67-1713(+)
MPNLAAALQQESPPPHVSTSPRQDIWGQSAFAAACRELLLLHEDEVSTLTLRCEKLENLLRSESNEETLTGIVCHCNDRISKHERLSVDVNVADFVQTIPLEMEETTNTAAEDAYKSRASRSRSSYVSSGLSHIATFNRAEPERAGILQRFVTGNCFELMSCSMVVCNAFILAFESQYHGHSIGHALQHIHHSTTANQQYPYGEVVLDACSWIFGIVFAIEVVLRMFASLRMCLRDAWAWFDAIIVIIWAISKMNFVVPVDSTVFRLTRLLRLLRLLKLARALSHFDSLVVIVTTTSSCAVILFWTFVTFGLVQLFFSLILTQYLHLFYFDSTVTSSDQALVFTYYGTFLRSYFTLWEITLGNWPPACRILAENVSEHFFTFGLTHKLLFGFAVVAIINAVFIQETFKVTARDDVIMVRQKNAVLKNHMKKMSRLLSHGDIDGDGKLCIEEWEALVQDPGLKLWLASMDLDVHDARFIFQLCDTTSDGYLTLDELIHGIGRYKGPAKNVDLFAFAERFNRTLIETMRAHEPSLPIAPQCALQETKARA